MKNFPIIQRTLKWYSHVTEQPILTSFLVLIIVSILVLGLSAPYYLNDFKDFYKQVLAEAHGMIFDIAIIGILILWLNKSGEKRLRIKTYKDEIDDFRLWKSEEAAFRTVGNIKRLNRHKIYNINLVNCFLTKTNLNYCILEGSNLNSADINTSQLIECNLRNARLNQTNFENSTLNQADLSHAYASGANFRDAFLIKAQMVQAYLIKAELKGAFLMEANLNGAYLTGADFTGANLYKADLRNAVGLTLEQLEKARTLYLAQLDEDLMEQVKLRLPSLVEK
ncbi:pentapeptide repeat-containing protein [Nafulsella turpanensis]|uniref:pentapeptide repeat-containing protein n=1 Tax=Nafulsella turpanensis TaxID=1265690 RepID=UPI00034BBC5B|nr:pentapeptide repeat-containing protein [Nafulsella turpanensis]